MQDKLQEILADMRWKDARIEELERENGDLRRAIRDLERAARQRTGRQRGVAHFRPVPVGQPQEERDLVPEANP